MICPRRVLIYGVTGSGKTTFARRLSEVTGIPWHSVDDLTWEPGWVSIPNETQREKIQAICEGATWILDSAYGKWLDIPLDSVELIIGLDYPRVLSFWRLLTRTVARARTKELMCNGNVESWKLTFSRDSILVWHFKSFRSKHNRILAWSQDPNGPTVFRFTSPRQAERWLRELESSVRNLDRQDAVGGSVEL